MYICCKFLKYSGSALKSVRIRWKKSASCLKIKSHLYFTFKKVILTINNNCNLWTRIFRERLNFRKHVLVFNNKRLIFNLYTFFFVILMSLAFLYSSMRMSISLISKQYTLLGGFQAMLYPSVCTLCPFVLRALVHFHVIDLRRAASLV